MIVRFTQDIKTQQPVYVICTNAGVAKTLTTSVTQAIRLAQTKTK